MRSHLLLGSAISYYELDRGQGSRSTKSAAIRPPDDSPSTPPTPFGAGFLCVKAPTQRIGSVQASGTSGVCDGTVSIDVLAWAQTHPSGQGAPYTAGMTLDFQCAIRDPLSPGTRVMSDALQVTLLP